MPPVPPESHRAELRALSPRERLLLAGLVVVAALLAGCATWYYDAIGLRLSHYDAKAHLVVARRILDSLTPGWRQIGAVWLPLPHVLNALPVQIDAFYRSGFSGVAISFVAFLTAVASVAWLVLTATRSKAATLAAAVLLGANPHLLYLQATPMTEPLLIGLLCLGIALLYRWTVAPTHAAAGPGCILALACLTRYEAWPVTAAALALAALARWRLGDTVLDSARRVARIAALPAAAIALFLVLSRATVGEWFVTGGFYVPDNRAHHRPLIALAEVWWGLHQLIGWGPAIVGAVGAASVLCLAFWRPSTVAQVLALALAGTAALPWYAFVSGHPFRIRYMAVLAAAVAACAGLGLAGLPRRLRSVAAGVVALVSLYEAPPFAQSSPLLAEAQWDRPFGLARRTVTACLTTEFRRPQDKILASMGSLAHYMQELSLVGFRLDDFIHEGIGELWPAALESPARHVQWILFEERAEGGDVLTIERKRSPDLVLGFTRVCEGGGVALYRRNAASKALSLEP